jgi:LmbE family N-acetylglucosaminyl deacetylase
LIEYFIAIAAINILHLAPHPDDESIACPAILSALVQAGHRVDNLACSLGAAGQEERRRRELEAACQILNFSLIIPEPLPAIDSSANPAEAQGEVESALLEIVDNYDLVVSPSSFDLHPGHEAVGRAVRAVLRTRPEIVWWQWGLWADLPLPAIIYPFEQPEMEHVIQALDCHAGENQRNDYRRLVVGRAEMNTVLGPERCFGFGTTGIEAQYAEVVSEVRRSDDRWILSAPRFLSPAEPLADNSDELLSRPRAYLRGRSKEQEINFNPDITEIIEERSITETLGRG